MLDELLKQAENERAAKRRGVWSRYRALLEESISGKLTTGKANELLNIIGELRLATADAIKHEESLKNHARMLAKVATIPQLEAQRNALAPQIDSLAEERAAAIAAIDAKLNPLMAEAAGIEQELNTIRLQYEANLHREPGRHPDLYGVAGEVKQQLRLSPKEMEEQSHRSDVWSDWTSCRAMVLGGRTLADFDWSVLDTIQEVLRYSQQPPDHLWQPEGGWPRLEEFPAAALIDPRRKSALTAARAKKAGRMLFNDMLLESQTLLKLGVRLGWLDENYRPVKKEDAEEVVESEAAAS